jgi:hypothetical protein
MIIINENVELRFKRETMNTSKENLLLHPLRMRILMAVIGRQVTAQQLADELPDIPQASLYRSLNALAAGGILAIVQERRTRNTIEKVYALQEKSAFLSAADLAQAQPGDYMRLFTQYLGLLLGYYGRYLNQDAIDHAHDGVGYTLVPLNLSKSEFADMARSVNAALTPFIQNQPAPDRQRYIFGLVTIPDVAGPQPNRNQK